MSPTIAALCGSIATAIAIFGGGLAVEAYKRHRDRMGMALALAGAIDALLSLIEARRMPVELEAALGELEEGKRVEFATLTNDNGPFNAITLSYANQIGNLGRELPFRVARFLTHCQGLQQDVERLARGCDQPRTQAALIRAMMPLWLETGRLGKELVIELKAAGGVR